MALSGHLRMKAGVGEVTGSETIATGSERTILREQRLEAFRLKRGPKGQ